MRKIILDIKSEIEIRSLWYISPFLSFASLGIELGESRTVVDLSIFAYST